MSGNVVAWVYEWFPVTTEIDRNRKIILSEVAEAANRDYENAHPGIAPICSRWAFGRSTVIAHLGWLVEHGWLEITERGRGRGHATVYRVRKEKVQHAGYFGGEKRSRSEARKGPDQRQEKVQIGGPSPYVSSSSNSPSNSPAASPTNLCFECNDNGWIFDETIRASRRCACNPERAWKIA